MLVPVWYDVLDETADGVVLEVVLGEADSPDGETLLTVELDADPSDPDDLRDALTEALTAEGEIDEGDAISLCRLPGLDEGEPDSDDDEDEEG